ncbi:hypothetical protein C8R44DRAFT_866717 [Mycena epipterygia]|nr:hypothetical protein C8R44DRAFT_866717 [Mycena epipterygia]
MSSRSICPCRRARRVVTGTPDSGLSQHPLPPRDVREPSPHDLPRASCTAEGGRRQAAFRPCPCRYSPLQPSQQVLRLDLHLRDQEMCWTWGMARDIPCVLLDYPRPHAHAATVVLQKPPTVYIRCLHSRSTLVVQQGLTELLSSYLFTNSFYSTQHTHLHHITIACSPKTPRFFAELT